MDNISKQLHMKYDKDYLQNQKKEDKDTKFN